MAGYISEESIEAILNTVDIVSVVGEYTKLENRGGNNWWGCCPFHSEKTPSFSVSNEKKFYYCFGCHKGGNVVNFVMEMEKLSYPDALHNLAKKAGVVIKYKDGYAPSKDDTKKIDELNQMIELYERVAGMFNYFILETPQGKKALDYVLKRGLTLDTIKKFKLGYSPADPKWLKKFLLTKNYSEEFLNKTGLFSSKIPIYSFFNDRLMFPIFNRKGQVVAFGGRVLPPANESERKYVNSSDLPQFKKRETLFGFNFAKDSIRKNKKIIFCEGNMDVIAYHQCGIDYAVATLGTALTAEHIKMIQGFVAGGSVYLSFDSDGAGQNATKKAILLCRNANLNVKIIRLQGGKDPAEIMIKYGAENLTAQVNSAILDSDYLLFRLGEKYPIDTPEGKTSAALEYFEYIDALQSDIHKESCLEQLCQTYNLKPEAVKRDFNNRNRARGHITTIRPNENQEQKKTQVKLNAELRGLIAVLADVKQFQTICSQISVDDLYNPAAKELFKILQECYDSGLISIPDIINRCENEDLRGLITESIVSGVYQSENIAIIIDDTIKFVKKNRIDERRNKLIKRIKEYSVITEDDQKQFNALLVEKMELDKEAQLLSK